MLKTAKTGRASLLPKSDSQKIKLYFIHFDGWSYMNSRMIDQTLNTNTAIVLLDTTTDRQVLREVLRECQLQTDTQHAKHKWRGIKVGKEKCNWKNNSKTRKSPNM